MIYYGVYSKKQESILGHHSIYLNENGEEVVVTEISKDPTFQSIKWDDVIKKGVVTKWIRTNYHSNTLSAVLSCEVSLSKEERGRNKNHLKCPNIGQPLKGGK